MEKKKIDDSLAAEVAIAIEEVRRALSTWSDLDEESDEVEAGILQ